MDNDVVVATFNYRLGAFGITSKRKAIIILRMNIFYLA